MHIINLIMKDGFDEVIEQAIIGKRKLTGTLVERSSSEKSAMQTIMKQMTATKEGVR